VEISRRSSDVCAAAWPSPRAISVSARAGGIVELSQWSSHSSHSEPLAGEGRGL
jgi:hypothetical protein